MSRGGALLQNAPRSPARGVTIDAPQSLTPASCTAIGLAEIAQRQKLIRVNATVWGYDGRQKG